MFSFSLAGANKLRAHRGLWIWLLLEPRLWANLRNLPSDPMLPGLPKWTLTNWVASNNRNLCYHSSGSYKSETKVLAWLGLFGSFVGESVPGPLLLSGPCWQSWHSLAGRCVSPVSLSAWSHSTCLCISVSFLVTTPVIKPRVHPTPEWPPLNRIKLQGTSFQRQSQS